MQAHSLGQRFVIQNSGTSCCFPSWAGQKWCPRVEIMTCWALLQEERPQDMSINMSYQHNRSNVSYLGCSYQYSRLIRMPISYVTLINTMDEMLLILLNLLLSSFFSC